MSRATQLLRTERRSWPRFGIGLRLLLAQALVLVAGAATTWVVAAIVGPPLFREHLHRAGVAADSPRRCTQKRHIPMPPSCLLVAL